MKNIDILFANSPTKVHDFLKNCVENLQKDNVKIKVANKDKVYFCGPSSGYFSESHMEIGIAVKKPFKQWFPVFIHEYCHYEQHKEDKQFFQSLSVGSTRFFSWIAKEVNVLEKTSIKDAKAIALLEADCERRTIKKIKQNHFEEFIEPEIYAKKANAYINFYLFVAKYRLWYETKKEPYNLPSVWEKYSSKINLRKQLTPEMENSFKKCIKNKNATPVWKYN